jgi:hypothetical protein
LPQENWTDRGTFLLFAGGDLDVGVVAADGVGEFVAVGIGKLRRVLTGPISEPDGAGVEVAASRKSGLDFGAKAADEVGLAVAVDVGEVRGVGAALVGPGSAGAELVPVESATRTLRSICAKPD